MTIDANMPFAGRTLTVNVAVEVSPYTQSPKALSLPQVLHSHSHPPSPPKKAIESLESGRFETVHLAAGCFWGLELALQRTRGVVGTSVGYTQGEKASPTYSEVCAGA